MPITRVDPRQWHPRATGIAELDRVLGGGLVAGSVTLVGGEPGVGKSTLLLQAAASLASDGARCLYVTGEESAAQVQGRADAHRRPRREPVAVDRDRRPRGCRVARRGRP